MSCCGTSGRKPEFGVDSSGTKAEPEQDPSSPTEPSPADTLMMPGPSGRSSEMSHNSLPGRYTVESPKEPVPKKWTFGGLFKRKSGGSPKPPPPTIPITIQFEPSQRADSDSSLETPTNGLSPRKKRQLKVSNGSRLVTLSPNVQSQSWESTKRVPPMIQAHSSSGSLEGSSSRSSRAGVKARAVARRQSYIHSSSSDSEESSFQGSHSSLSVLPGRGRRVKSQGPRGSPLVASSPNLNPVHVPSSPRWEARVVYTEETLEPFVVKLPKSQLFLKGATEPGHRLDLEPVYANLGLGEHAPVNGHGLSGHSPTPPPPPRRDFYRPLSCSYLDYKPKAPEVSNNGQLQWERDPEESSRPVSVSKLGYPVHKLPAEPKVKEESTPSYLTPSTRMALSRIRSGEKSHSESISSMSSFSSTPSPHFNRNGHKGVVLAHAGRNIKPPDFRISPVPLGTRSSKGSAVERLRLSSEVSTGSDTTQAQQQSPADALLYRPGRFERVPSAPKNPGKNLEDALNELELMYKSLRLSDEDLLDRAERRDLPTAHQELRDKDPVRVTHFRFSPQGSLGSLESLTARARAPPLRRSSRPDPVSDDMAQRRYTNTNGAVKKNDPMELVSQAGSYLVLSPAFSPPVTPEPLLLYTNDPDLTSDDVTVRNYRRANSIRLIEEPQPLFGIPLGPVTKAADSDYLHSKPVEKYRPLFRHMKNPDIVKDDAAYRTLRKDLNGDPTSCNWTPRLFSPSGSTEALPGADKKLRAQRSLSANVSQYFPGVNEESKWNSYSDLNLVHGRRSLTPGRNYMEPSWVEQAEIGEFGRDGRGSQDGVKLRENGSSERQVKDETQFSRPSNSGGFYDNASYDLEKPLRIHSPDPKPVPSIRKAKITKSSALPPTDGKPRRPWTDILLQSFEKPEEEDDEVFVDASAVTPVLTPITTPRVTPAPAPVCTTEMPNQSQGSRRGSLAEQQVSTEKRKSWSEGPKQYETYSSAHAAILGNLPSKLQFSPLPPPRRVKQVTLGGFEQAAAPRSRAVEQAPEPDCFPVIQTKPLPELNVSVVTHAERLSTASSGPSHKEQELNDLIDALVKEADSCGPPENRETAHTRKKQRRPLSAEKESQWQAAIAEMEAVSKPVTASQSQVLAHQTISEVAQAPMEEKAWEDQGQMQVQERSWKTPGQAPDTSSSWDEPDADTAGLEKSQPKSNEKPKLAAAADPVDPPPMVAKKSPLEEKGRRGLGHLISGSAFAPIIPHQVLETQKSPNKGFWRKPSVFAGGASYPGLVACRSQGNLPCWNKENRPAAESKYPFARTENEAEETGAIIGRFQIGNLSQKPTTPNVAEYVCKDQSTISSGMTGVRRLLSRENKAVPKASALQKSVSSNNYFSRISTQPSFFKKFFEKTPPADPKEKGTEKPVEPEPMNSVSSKASHFMKLEHDQRFSKWRKDKDRLSTQPVTTQEVTEAAQINPPKDWPQIEQGNKSARTESVDNLEPLSPSGCEPSTLSLRDRVSLFNRISTGICSVPGSPRSAHRSMNINLANSINDMGSLYDNLNDIKGSTPISIRNSRAKSLYSRSMESADLSTDGEVSSGGQEVAEIISKSVQNSPVVRKKSWRQSEQEPDPNIISREIWRRKYAQFENKQGNLGSGITRSSTSHEGLTGFSNKKALPPTRSNLLPILSVLSSSDDQLVPTAEVPRRRTVRKIEEPISARNGNPVSPPSDLDLNSVPRSSDCLLLKKNMPIPRRKSFGKSNPLKVLAARLDLRDFQGS